MTAQSRAVAPRVPSADGPGRADSVRVRADPGAGGGRAQISLGPIIRAKIQPPVLRSSTLSRQRLIERLQVAVRSRLTLLVAEAGYGKTTLMTDFAARTGVRTLWYRLDATDADVITWTNHIIAAAREVQPDFGQATLGLMAQMQAGGPPRSAFLASVIGELGELEPVPTILVLDDFHAVDTSPDAVEFTTRLLRDSPPWLSLIISTRRRPTLELSRLSAAGELTEIGTDELRFSHDEQIDLFANSYGMPLDEDVLRDLDRRTKGWIASLQLFHGSVRGRAPSAVRAFAKALSGATSPVYDFLAEEVLNNIPERLERMLVGSSILERITAGLVVALFGDDPQPPSLEQARDLIEEADRLTLVSQSSQSSDARELHPLLRDYLTRALHQRYSVVALDAMHLRVARAVIETEPLTAAHHFLEAGQEADAMRCLGASVVLTMGSGQWGVASDLIERMRDVPADPAVAAIRARGLIEAGDLEGGATLLRGVDVAASAPDVRAVFRHTKLSLGWRTGDRDLMFDTLRDIHADPETPAVMREISQIFVDASPLSPTPIPYATLATRLEGMARSQREAGHTYYAAISLHNAALTLLAAGRLGEATRLGSEALSVFDALPHFDTDKYSTHAVLALCAFEQGHRERGEDHLRTALSSGTERGDVHAECAYALVALGDRARANRLLLSADELERRGRSDVTATLIGKFARSLLVAPGEPQQAIGMLSDIPAAMPLDTGYDLERQMLMALVELLAGHPQTTLEISAGALGAAGAKGARRVTARLNVIAAMAAGDADAFREAVSFAASVGDMALLVVADGICRFLWLAPEIPNEIHNSVARWPRRWLPALRRQLDAGGTANAMAAARLLDEFGEAADVTKLRAFAKTYRRQLRGGAALGRGLSRRVAPTLSIFDLGRAKFIVGAREVNLAQMRRKSAALLMLLVTRPGHTATREQVLDELWPDSDPESAANNLNQSLYFLRRDIDPSFEDDISVEYVGLQGDVVWLSVDLTSVASVVFATQARTAIVESVGDSDPTETLCPLHRTLLSRV